MAKDWMGRDPMDKESGFNKYVLPLSTIVGAIAGAGGGQQNTPVGSTVDMLSGLEEKKRTYRQRSLQDQLGEAETKEKLGDIDVQSKLKQKLLDIYAQDIPEPEKEAQAISTYKSMMGSTVFGDIIKNKARYGEGGRQTDFMRKLEYLRGAYPDASESELYKMIANPSSQFGPSEERLTGAQQLAEMAAMGGLTPKVTEGKAGQAATVETAKEKASLGLTPEKAKAATEIEKAKIIGEAETKKPLERQAAINEKVGAVNLINNSLDNLLKAYNAVPGDLKGYIGGKVGESQLAGVFQSPETRAKVQTYNSMKDKMSREVAKAMEGGRISDQDAAFYQKMMGNLQMYPEQQVAAVKTMKDYGLSQVKSMQATQKQLTPGAVPKAGGIPEYASEEEARAAGHKNGDRIKINGQYGELE
jgi:hypothetical protein